MSDHRHGKVCEGLNVSIISDINSRKAETPLSIFLLLRFLLHHFGQTPSEAGSLRGPLQGCRSHCVAKSADRGTDSKRDSKAMDGTSSSLESWDRLQQAAPSHLRPPRPPHGRPHTHTGCVDPGSRVRTLGSDSGHHGPSTSIGDINTGQRRFSQASLHDTFSGMRSFWPPSLEG